VVHRDVKPENVLIPESEVEKEGVKLTDFGIAKLVDVQGVTSTGQVLGSPAHMAPEQIEGGAIDGRADIFGVGILLYECMVGRLPFTGSNPAHVLRLVLEGHFKPAEAANPEIGAIYSKIIDRALARNAGHRYASADEFACDLRAELERLGIESSRSEFANYINDPDGYRVAHRAVMVARLCERGDKAQREGNIALAAADFNRAVAYAPHDTRLLRHVAAMRRAERRRRRVRRLVPVGLVGGIGVAIVGFCIVFSPASGLSTLKMALEKRRPGPTHNPTASEGEASSRGENKGWSAEASRDESEGIAGRPLQPTMPDATADAGREPGAPTELPADRTTPQAASPNERRTTRAASKVSRFVQFTSLYPAFGVELTLDGQPQTDPIVGSRVALPDLGAHRLSLTCRDRRTGAQMCDAKTIEIAPGDADETLAVELTILPAKLVVRDANVLHSYTLEEANLTVAAGVVAEVPMRRGTWTVHIFDRADPAKRKTVQLVAGQLHEVAFDQW